MDPVTIHHMPSQHCNGKGHEISHWVSQKTHSVQNFTSFTTVIVTKYFKYHSGMGSLSIITWIPSWWISWQLAVRIYNKLLSVSWISMVCQFQYSSWNLKSSVVVWEATRKWFLPKDSTLTNVLMQFQRRACSHRSELVCLRRLLKSEPGTSPSLSHIPSFAREASLFASS